jgi:hypothetical protein
MDETGSIVRRPGGAVEPLKRASIAKGLFQTPHEAPAVRFELRDPFADVTYRARSLEEMVAKAEQVGAIRFTEIAKDGTRSSVLKADGYWTRAGKDRGIRPEPGQAARMLPEQAARAADAHADVASTTTVDVDTERQQRRLLLERSLSERYLIKRAAIRVGEVQIGQTEYRHRGDPSRIAFTESAFRLSTDNDSPSVARSMVDVAEARNWQGLRVSGSEEFRRLVWLEATARGVRTIGYEPVPADHDLARKAQEARQLNRVERSAGAPPGTAGDAAKKESSRGGARKSVLAAIEAVLIARRVPEARRQAVMRVATEELARRAREGEVHRVKIYDKAAPPPERVAPQRVREVQRSQERAGPTR